MSAYRARTTMLLLLLLLCTLSACTTAPPRTATTSASPVHVTGSMIAAPSEPNPALQVVTYDQMMQTGEPTVGAALRLLVPSAQ
jgi:outer membrane receptor protein involved in Fe transport